MHRIKSPELRRAIVSEVPINRFSLVEPLRGITAGFRPGIEAAQITNFERVLLEQSRVDGAAFLVVEMMAGDFPGGDGKAQTLIQAVLIRILADEIFINEAAAISVGGSSDTKPDVKYFPELWNASDPVPRLGRVSIAIQPLTLQRLDGVIASEALETGTCRIQVS